MFTSAIFKGVGSHRQERAKAPFRPGRQNSYFTTEPTKNRALSGILKIAESHPLKEVLPTALMILNRYKAVRYKFSVQHIKLD